MKLAVRRCLTSVAAKRRVIIAVAVFYVISVHVIYNGVVKHYRMGTTLELDSAWIAKIIWKSSEGDGLPVDLHVEDSIFGHTGEIWGHSEDDDISALRKNFTAIVAVGLGITSNGVKDTQESAVAKNFQFFHTFIPSFCKTASTGYRYDFYLAYDHTDKVFSKMSFLLAFRNAFHATMSSNCSERVRTSIHMVQCDHKKKPTWAQNDAMLEAYLDNADYYYRVNDDTLMKTGNWTNAFVERLGKYDPQNVGVVGPTHSGGNTNILTYDFVHRSHVDIFGFYYPRLFTDWWGDDWVTGVYQPGGRMTKLPNIHLAHTLGLGQRYGVDFSVGGKLKNQLEKDRQTLTRYLRHLNETGVKTSSLEPNGTRIISMSLYGKDPLYTWGAIRNAQLTPIYFPGWRLRVYISGESHEPKSRNSSLVVPQRIIRKLRQLGAEIKTMAPSDVISGVIPPRMWRHLVIDDPTVEYFLIRDADSRLSDRDAYVVNEWLNGNGDVLEDMKKGKDVTNAGEEGQKKEQNANDENRKKSPVIATLHCIRDHPKHSDHPIVDGLWGGHGPSIRKSLASPGASNIAATLRSWFISKTTTSKTKVSYSGQKSTDILTSNSIKNQTSDTELLRVDNRTKQMDFVAGVIWPLLKSSAMCHDSTTCETGKWGSDNIRGIPVPRQPSTEYLGQKFDEHQEVKSTDGKILEKFVGRNCSIGMTISNELTTVKVTTITPRVSLLDVVFNWG